MDVHQECQKFATGGQGNDSGRVVIWNLMPVLSEKAESDESVPKMLCQMDNHLACVNCVRWSQSGLMLASGSDDKLVMIWQQSKVGFKSLYICMRVYVVNFFSIIQYILYRVQVVYLVRVVYRKIQNHGNVYILYVVIQVMCWIWPGRHKIAG